MPHLTITTHACAKGACMPLVPQNGFMPGHVCANMPYLKLGAELKSDRARFQIVGYMWMPALQPVKVPLLIALEEIPAGEIWELRAEKNGYAIACVTLSDKGAQGLREDKSGPLMQEMIGKELSVCFSRNFLLPDDAAALRGLLASLALEQGYDLICTSGGTGLGPRDITPQVTGQLIDLPLPGFVQAMMQTSLAKTPRAIISRARAGIIHQSIVINLPGSARAVAENLAAVLPGLDHALAKLHGDPSDCGSAG